MTNFWIDHQIGKVQELTNNNEKENGNVTVIRSGKKFIGGLSPSNANPILSMFAIRRAYRRRLSSWRCK